LVRISTKTTEEVADVDVGTECWTRRRGRRWGTLDDDWRRGRRTLDDNWRRRGGTLDDDWRRWGRTLDDNWRRTRRRGDWRRTRKGDGG
jgi:hypothetical protein